MRPSNPLLSPSTQTGKAARRLSRDIVGSNPTSVTGVIIKQATTENTIAWSSGEDVCPTCRRPMVRFHPRSLDYRPTRKAAGYGSPGCTANACHLRVMRVRLPRLPLKQHGSMVKRKSPLDSNQKFRVRFLVGLLKRN